MIYIGFFVLQIVVLFLLSRKIQQLTFRYFLNLTGNKKRTVFLFSLLFSIGTLIHEFAHMLAAIVLFVPVGEIDLTPKIENDRLTLGKVEIGGTDRIRQVIIGFAPLVFGLAVILLLVYIIFRVNLSEQWWIVPVLVYLVFGVGNSMFLSKKDLEGFWVLIIVVSVAALLLGALMMSGLVTFPRTLPAVLVDFFIQANIFLLVPIAIDVFVILLLK